jgi:hypothetical protein
MDMATFEKQSFFTTVRITIPDNSGQTASIGTGFLYVASLNDGSDRSITLLISNKHVFGDPRSTIMLNFNKKDENSEPLLGDIDTIEQPDFSGLYYPHPDPNVDLACINVSAITHRDIYFKNVHSGFMSNVNFADVFPGMDVWFVGYPANRFDTKHNLPILRRGHIASIPETDFNGVSQFVIDAHVYQGSSGSPVFAIINGIFKLLGVVTQTMIRHEKLQAVTSATGFGVEQTIGLGLVLKYTLVEELIASAVDSFVRQNPEEHRRGRC